MSAERFLAPLFGEFDAFEAELREAAFALVAEVFARELAARRAQLPPRADTDEDDGGDDGDGDDRDEHRATGVAGARAMARELAAEVERDRAGAAGEPSPTRTAGGPPRRGAWTRDQVIDELAEWMKGGTQIEAAFLVRHGHRALVTNAKRHFGRFEAALNAANLRLAQKYPEGIPSRKKPPAVA